jgi:hypothetical protein
MLLAAALFCVLLKCSLAVCFGYFALGVLIQLVAGLLLLGHSDATRILVRRF